MSEVKFLPFKARDLDSLEVQAPHQFVKQYVQVRPFTLIDAEDSLWSFTMWGDGKPRACCGIAESGAVWAFLAEDMKRYMLPLWRYGRAMIDARTDIVGPVWAQVDPKYPQAVHLVEMAKFRQLESSLWAYP